jgi:hypothetical protein
VEPLHDRAPSVELTPQLVAILTAEQVTLQAAQGQEVADVNGRTTLYLGAISGALGKAGTAALTKDRCRLESRYVGSGLAARVPSSGPASGVGGNQRVG